MKLSDQLLKLRDHLVYESLFVGLALASVGLLAYEFLGAPEPEAIALMGGLDFAIAWVFLADFTAGLVLAANKRRYFRENWYILLASIPINEHVFRSLRILRALRIIRIIRIGRIGSALSRTAVIPSWYRRTKAKKSRE